MRNQPEPGGERRRVTLPRISGYLIDGVLGRGGSSVVYRARQRSVDRVVALKVLHPSVTRTASTVKRLQREARLMAMLDHPNIVSAFDVGESADGWWLAMELVDGQALSEKLRRGGPLNEEEAIKIFLPLADALQHAHEAGVIHRDVKPGNIILTPAEEPRLVDLGLARSEDEPQLTRLGATMGTPHYVSPEQAKNPADVDARSDVYSLAATLHHAICGAPPFPGESPAEVMASVLHDSLTDPREVHPGISRGLALVLRKALSKDPLRRHASAREFGADLQLLLRGQKPLIRTKRLEPVRADDRRMPYLVVTLVVLAGFGGVMVLRGNEQVEREEPVEVLFSDLQHLEETWRGGDLKIAQALTLYSSLVPGAAERANYERFGEEIDRRLRGILSELRSKTDTSRSALLSEGRFEEARSALLEDFDAALQSSAGFTSATLPLARRSAITRWRESGLAQIEDALEALHREAGSSLSRWCERELWPAVREHTQKREFDLASEMLEPDLTIHLREAGVGTEGLDLKRLRRTSGWSSAEKTRQGMSYDLDRTWRELDEELISSVRSACKHAMERLERGEVLAVLEDLDARVRGIFHEAGLGLGEMPSRFSSRAVEELAARTETLARLEIQLSMKRTFETLERLDEESETFLSERRYSELLDQWRSERLEVEDAVKNFIDLRMEEAELLRDLLEDARTAVVAGETGAVVLREGGFKVESVVRLDGDPVLERFWVNIAPGSERAWRLAGPEAAKDGVRRVSRISLEGLAGRDTPCLEVAFLRLAEGDIQGASECYRGLDAAEALTRLGEELGSRLGPLLAEESTQELKKRAQAAHLVDAYELEQLLEGTPSKSLRMVEALLRDYGDVLDAKRLERVRSWRDVLERETAPATLQEFEAKFGADETRFPRRGRIELIQRFDDVTEGQWQSGSWVAHGVGWQAPRQAGIEQVITSKAPSLLLRDPFNLEAGPVEVVFEVKVPLDARARLVVVSAIGFHCALVTGGGEAGRIVAGSRDLEGVIGRVMGGEGDTFPGLHPGQSHRISMLANQARGTLTVLFDGEECVRIEDLSPKDRARSTSVSLRSLEPLLLLGAEIEAGRR